MTKDEDSGGRRRAGSRRSIARGVPVASAPSCYFTAACRKAARGRSRSRIPRPTTGAEAGHPRRPDVSVHGHESMTTFAYTAIGKDGQQTAGTLSADSRSAAIAEVVPQGPAPVRLDEQRAGAARRTARTAPPSPSRRAPSPPPPRSRPRRSRPPRTPPRRRPGGCRRRRSSPSPASWPTCWPAACRWRGRCSLLKREASNPAAKHLWSAIHDDVVGGTALADAMAKWPQDLFQRLRRHGPRGRGGRVPRRRPRTDRRLPHPRGRPQGQGQEPP